MYNVNFDISGQVAVITGAGGIICGTMAKEMAKKGVKIALLDLFVESAQKIADEMGLEMEIVNTDFDSIIGSIASGKGHIGASGFTINDERKEQVNFSVPYYTTTQYMIIPKGSDIHFVARDKARFLYVTYPADWQKA